MDKEFQDHFGHKLEVGGRVLHTTYRGSHIRITSGVVTGFKRYTVYWETKDGHSCYTTAPHRMVKIKELVNNAG